MGAFTYIETDTGTNVDISAATAVGAYTSTGDKLIMVDVSIDAVAGNGDYVMYVTRQIGGSGSAYRILPQTTMTAASGLTAISGQSGWITVRNGDVLTCYVDGLAGDTSTPDWSTRWFELAGVTAAAIADAVLDEKTADHTTAGSLSKAVADILGVTDTEIATIINHLIDIKGAGWDDGNLTNIYSQVASLENILVGIKGAGWTNETLVKIVSDIAAISAGSGASAQEVWEYVSRTLTDPDSYKADVSGLATQETANAIKAKTDMLDYSKVTVVPTVVGSTITILRGDTFKCDITGLGSLENYVSLDFTVKSNKSQADADALIRIRKNASGVGDGLLVLKGKAALNADDGSIVITDAVAGDITITIKAGVTKELIPSNYTYDIQLIEADEVSTLTGGTLIISPDVTRLVA